MLQFMLANVNKKATRASAKERFLKFTFNCFMFKRGQSSKNVGGARKNVGGASKKCWIIN